MSGLMVWPSGPLTPADGPDDANSEEAAHARAIKAHPDCAECLAGKGTVLPGPAHSRVHRGHCSCDGCY